MSDEDATRILARKLLPRNLSFTAHSDGERTMANFSLSPDSGVWGKFQEQESILFWRYPNFTLQNDLGYVENNLYVNNELQSVPPFRYRPVTDTVGHTDKHAHTYTHTHTQTPVLS